MGVSSFASRGLLAIFILAATLAPSLSESGDVRTSMRCEGGSVSLASRLRGGGMLSKRVGGRFGGFAAPSAPKVPPEVKDPEVELSASAGETPEPKGAGTGLAPGGKC